MRNKTKINSCFQKKKEKKETQIQMEKSTWEKFDGVHENFL